MFFTHLMRSCDSNYLVLRMVSVTTLPFLLFLLFTTAVAAAGEKKKNVDKIIIHVPYKIHKHHHTHTKYKVITVPAPKKENTVIYLKEQIQPVIKEVPVVHTQVEIAETQPKPLYHTPEMTIPPHQESSQSLMQSVIEHNNPNPTQTDQQKEYSTIADDQKPLETHLSQNSHSFMPSLTYQPMILSPQDNLIHDFSFKPMASFNQAFNPNYFINADFHQSYGTYFPKFPYQPMPQLPHHHLTPPHMFRSLLPNTKKLQDSVAHTSSQVYKTIIPAPKATSYKVKEENQEDQAVELVKHQHTSNAIPVPSLKFGKKGNIFVHKGHKYQLMNLNKIPSNRDYEYEHVGYLIIDGNSRKLVGKNFKDELHLSR